MKASFNSSRRQFLKIGSTAMVVIPVMALTGQASAATNAAMRTAMKYQDKPKDGKHCATCMHFTAGKTPKDLGGCKIFPGDTEVAPNAYCVAWAPIKAK